MQPDPTDHIEPSVRRLLDELRTDREDAARRMAATLDGWTGPVVVDGDAFRAARAAVPPSLVADIEQAHANIRAFADAQRATLHDFEIEVTPGLRAGHRLVPVSVAGCYVPAGRFAHIASALMSITTSRAAGVDTVIVSSPARADRGGVHPAILVAAEIAGADIVLGLGGVQGIGALAYGLFTDRPADIIVGPGNSYVAEAKRQLFGEVGIDVVAGPTESMIVADQSADPNRVAVDLVGQAEHGPDSPVWLVTTSPELAASVASLVPELATQLPEPGRSSALAAWEHHGEVIVVDHREHAARVCDEYAPEHLQVMADDLPWWHERLRNYGSLFLGEQATVTFGDKSAGPNHILPTGKAARYTGGLNVLTYLKQLTFQQLTDDAARTQGALAARISRHEGMEGHARSADLRTVDARAPAARVELDFTRQEPIPAAGIERANQLMQSGALFRYGEHGAEEADVALLEREFADLVGRRYCVALNSCGAALAVALLAAGVERDEPVMMNAFTLAPVPGAIAHAGAEPVFVGITPDWHIDVDDLRRAAETSGARWLLLSHMRGHIADMDRLTEACAELGVGIIEDCAHTMGASWRGQPTGTFGVAGCFSTQAFKHVNSGEGGLLVTDDEDLAARAVLYSGSYMLYDQHGAGPTAEVFERHRMTTPNFSMRMSALTAAVARPQLALLPDRARRWNERYAQLAGLLAAIDGVRIPERHPDEGFVASSIQFDVRANVERMVERAATSGVPIKWFGAPDPHGFTSRFDHWRYAPEQPLATTSTVLDGLCDMRIPLAMTASDAERIVAVIASALAD